MHNRQPTSSSKTPSTSTNADRNPAPRHGAAKASPRPVASRRPSTLKTTVYVVIICLSLIVGLGVVARTFAPEISDIAIYEAIRSRWAQARAGMPSERRPHSRDGTSLDTDGVEVQAAPPPLRGVSGQPSSSSSSGPEDAKQNATGLTCYTLEGYSDVFTRARPGRSRKRYFQCGVRVTDLRTESRADHRTACEAATSTTSTAQETTVYPHLRIVLTEKEVVWHRQMQLNAAAQRIPLQHINDDYCDCMDGTDELLTNACSMVTGAGMPLVGSRWRSYLVANTNVQLYEDAPPLKDDNIRRMDLSHSSQGPVLPVACAEDPSVLLSPWLVGDGVVDCTDGSDESEEVWTRAADASLVSQDEDESAAASAARRDHHARVQALRKSVAVSVQRGWQRQRDALRTLRTGPWVASSSAYTTPLNPQHVNARALLVDTGYLSLFTTGEVFEAKVELSEVLHKLFLKGHALYKTRVARGWDKFGKVIVDRRMNKILTLINVTQRYDHLRHLVEDEVTRRGVETPIEAGVNPQILMELDHLEMAKGDLENDIRYNDIIIQQRLFGDHYEYYPLHAKILALPYAAASDPSRTSETGRAERTKTVMNVLQAYTAQRDEMHRLAARGHDLSSAAVTAASVLHVDNISADMFGIHYGRHLLWRQSFSVEKDGEVVARIAGLVKPDEPYDPSVLVSKPDESVFQRSPTFVTGHWMPYSVRRSATLLTMTDPAGDAALPRRLMVRPETPLLRSSGTLQYPHRDVEKERFLSLKKQEDENANAAERLRKAQKQVANEEKEEDTVKVPLFYHQNTPNRVAMHVFRGGSLRCDETIPAHYQQDPATASPDEEQPVVATWGGMVSACDTTDRILSWAMDGRCMQEVVVGTPSACADWVIHASKQQLDEHKQRLFAWKEKQV